MELGQVVEKLESSQINRKLKPGTRQFYARMNEMIVDWLGTTFSIDDLTTQLIERWIEGRRAKRIQDSTIQRELHYLQMVYRFARSIGVWEGDIDSFIPLDLQTNRVRTLSREEVSKILPLLTPGAAAVMAFGIATMSEWHCIRHAYRTDIPTLEQLYSTPLGLMVRLRSQFKDRIIPIVTVEQSNLLAYAVHWGQQVAWGDKFSPAPHNAIKEFNSAIKTLKLKAFSIDDLKYTGAQWLRDGSQSIEDIANWVGFGNTTKLTRLFSNTITNPSHLIQIPEPRAKPETLLNVKIETTVPSQVISYRVRVLGLTIEQAVDMGFST